MHVVVVGGGPAGSAAAISLRQAGARVTVLERERFPRPRPGETLHPGIEPLLTQLGVTPLPHWPRHTGHWIAWDAPLRNELRRESRHEVRDEARHEAFGSDADGPWRGFQAWRAELDELLLERARACGAEVREGDRAQRPLVADGRVNGVATTQGDLAADLVFDAAGAGHWLARHLDLPIVEASPRLWAAYGYAAARGPGNNTASGQVTDSANDQETDAVRDQVSGQLSDPVITREETGWHWSARVRPDLTAHVRLSWNGEQPELPEADAGEVLRADATWRCVQPAAGPGYFCLGDAAAVLDPAASHGVLKALMSGIMAAHVARHGAGARAYDDWVARWFEEDVRRLQALYGSRAT